MVDNQKSKEDMRHNVNETVIQIHELTERHKKKQPVWLNFVKI